MSEKPKATGNDEKPSETTQLKNDIASFSKQSASLKPEDAAQQWLKLLDRQFNLSPTQLASAYGYARSRQQFNPMDIWTALPAPPAWDALRKDIEARPPGKDATVARELCLRFIAHTLVADRKAQTNDLAQMEVLAAKSADGEDMILIEVVGELSQGLLENSSNPDGIIKSLERRLAMESYGGDFSVPNLVPLVGAQKAEAFFRRAFTNSNLTTQSSLAARKRKARP